MLAHIDAYLEDMLDVDGLARVTAFFWHHFHCRFPLLFGMNVRRYVQLLRLKRVVHQLAYRDNARITDIVLACGYEGPEALVRASHRQVGQSPLVFRVAPRWIPWATDLQVLCALRSQHMPAQPRTQSVEIVERRAVTVVAIKYCDDPVCLSETLRTFIVRRREHWLHPSVSAAYNVAYDNPDGVPPEAFRMNICTATRASTTPNVAGAAGRASADGRYTVLCHMGSDDALGQSIAYLCADWLPAGGEGSRDVPLLFQRVRFYPDVPKREAVTDALLSPR